MPDDNSAKVEILLSKIRALTDSTNARTREVVLLLAQALNAPQGEVESLIEAALARLLRG